MKKLMAAVLVSVLVITLAACGKKDKKEDSADVDLQYYANVGQLPEADYKLGENPDTVSSELSAAYEKAAADGEDYIYDVTEGEQSVRIDNGSVAYYYEKDKKDGGVSFIASFDKAYGFENGTTILEIKKAVGDIDCTEEAADENNTFFLFGIQDGTVLKYKFEKNTIMFVFEENMLCAAAIYSNSNWTLS